MAENVSKSLMITLKNCFEFRYPNCCRFWAEWCGPCKMIAPSLEQLADEHVGTFKVGKLNVDDNRETAMKYGIRSIPTLLVIKEGRCR